MVSTEAGNKDLQGHKQCIRGLLLVVGMIVTAICDTHLQAFNWNCFITVRWDVFPSSASVRAESA